MAVAKRLSREIGRLLILAALLLPVFTAVAGNAAAMLAWYDADWPYRKIITVDSARVPATLTDFPMLVSLNDGNIKAHAQADADDILFTAADGVTKLSHEIERYNAATGELVAWVKMPVLPSGSDTSVYLYYGNPAAADQQAVADVWSNGYEAVYHLNGDYTDSTGSHNAANSGSAAVSGVAADGREFTPASAIDAGSWSVSGYNVTLQGWIRPDNFGQDDPRIISKADGGDAENHAFMLGLGGSDNRYVRGRIKTGNSDSSGTTTLEAGTNPAVPGAWQLAALTYDGFYMRLYRDGQYAAATYKSGWLRTNSWDVAIGNNPGNTDTDWASLDGRLDEVRVSSVARSAEWLQTEYNNQSDPASFYTITGDPGWTQTSQGDFSGGVLDQLDAATSPGDVMLAKAGEHVYALRGNDSDDFWRYDAATDSWVVMADAPDNVKYGGALAYDGGNYIYALGGNNSNRFWRYDIGADSWAALTPAPGNVKEGGSLTYHNSGFVYAMRGNNSHEFWRYNVVTGVWVSLAPTVDSVQYGGALTDDDANYVYALQCDDTEAFFRYDISANSWTLMANTPDVVGNGAALAYDGDNYVYALRGRYTDDFWRYDVADNSWELLPGTPTTLEWGGALTHDGGSYLYALRGKNKSDFWRYDIAAGTWTARAYTIAKVQYGGALADTVAYPAAGTLTSSSYDAGYAADFGSLHFGAALPTGTSVRFQLATNNDNATWEFLGPDGTPGTYYTSSGETIWPGQDGDRYIKYKAYLATTDTAYTPRLHDVSVTYIEATAAMPAATTAAAALVEETTATLNGAVADDGGEACEYRFQYGTAPGVYSENTTWTGSKTTGQPFDVAVSTLSEGTKYYFRAQVRNSAGTASGGELSLLTKPLPPTDFVATPAGGNQVNLTWVKGTGAQRTMVRRKDGGYPADYNDGVEVYFDTGTSAADNGLNPETEYYYRAWSEVTGSQQWSDAYAAVVTTTGSGSTPPPPNPTAVGGIVMPVDKTRLLAPWLALAAVLGLMALGGLRLVFRHQRKAS